MRQVLIISFIFLLSLSVEAQNIVSDSLKKHVYTLASKEFAGRKAGTSGGAKAARYIVDELSQMGLKAQVDTMLHSGVKLMNVSCVIEGCDPKLKDEWLIIISHYDHIGRQFIGDVFPGANDNAVSVAALLEMVRNRKDSKRSILFLWSDAEEDRALGARLFSENLPMNESNVKLVIACEMLGHLDRTNKLECVGISNTIEGESIFLGVDCAEGLLVNYDKRDTFLKRTDTLPFFYMGIPTMVWHTPSLENLHQTTDTAETIDYEGLKLITTHVLNCLWAFADNDKITASEIVEKIKK